MSNPTAVQTLGFFLVWVCLQWNITWQLPNTFLFKAALVTPTIFITFHQNYSSAGFLGRTRNCIGCIQTVSPGLIFIFIILLAPVFIIVFVFSAFIHDWNDGWWCFSDVATKPSRHILCRATPSCATPVPHLPVLQHLVLHLPVLQHLVLGKHLSISPPLASIWALPK